MSALNLLNLPAIPDLRKLDTQITLAMAEIPVIHSLLDIIKKQHETIQQKNDEIAALKGHKGRPKIPKSILGEKEKEEKKAEEGPENEKKKRAGSSKREKTKALTIHKKVRIRPPDVPEGAVFKGYKEYVVQGIEVKPLNVCYLLERWETPDGKYLVGRLPERIKGHFDPSLKSFIQYLSYQCHVTQPLLREALMEWGVDISKGQLSRTLTEKHEAFHQEKEAILKSGLQSSRYFHVDDTSARHKGVNGFCTHIGNELFAYFASGRSKNRLNFLNLLRADAQDYVIDKNALDYMASQKLAKAVIAKLEGHPKKVFEDRKQWETHLKMLEITAAKHLQITTEAALLGSALANGLPEDLVIVSDDAGQFNILNHALCWVHCVRNIEKVGCYTMASIEIKRKTLDKIWEFYKTLKAYRKAPTKRKATAIKEHFDTIFTTPTGYKPLDEAMKRVHQNKKELLVVLERPEIPLHNNLSESDLREYVKRRKISGSTRSALGRDCRDTFTSLKKTCRKLGISFWQYLNDRNNGLQEVSYLPDLILEGSHC